MPSRYYFNLTNGDEVIRDEDGIEVPDVRTALVYAFEAIEELKALDLSSSEEWHGWRLDIIDGSGNLIHSLPLDNAALGQSSHH